MEIVIAIPVSEGEKMIIIYIMYEMKQWIRKLVSCVHDCSLEIQNIEWLNFGITTLLKSCVNKYNLSQQVTHHCVVDDVLRTDNSISMLYRSF